MKTLIVALVVCLAAPAFAQDMGTNASVKQEQKCEGVAATPDEAAGFATNYNLLILTITQVLKPEDLPKLVSEAEQQRVVKVLQKFDAIAKGNGLGCVDSSVDDLKLTLEVATRFTNVLQQGPGKQVYIQLLFMVTNGDKQKAVQIIDGFIAVAKRTAAYVDSASGTSL